LNKPLFESTRAVQTLPHAYNSKKVLAGLFSIALILLLSLAMLKMPQQVRAETSIPKPAVPEFTIELIDSSYDIPPTSSVDHYTGQTVTQAGRHVESRTIKLSIKNQPFTPFQVEDENGNSWAVDFQYNIRWKGHFEQDWHEIYIPTNGFAGANLESEYTVISFEGEYSSSEGLKLYYQGLIATFPPDAQVDFQVEAMIGYVHRDPSLLGWIFTGETSGWSNTQTLTISESQTPTPSPPNSPTPSPKSPQTEIVTIAAVVIIASVFSAALGLLSTLSKENKKSGELSFQRLSIFSELLHVEIDCHHQVFYGVWGFLLYAPRGDEGASSASGV
jgi:hypothetical protein